MNKIRTRRLYNEIERLEKLQGASNGRFCFRASGRPPERYLFEFGCRSLVKSGDGEPRVIDHCLVQVYLPPGYPRLEAPVALVHTPGLFHPNVRAENPGKGLVCLGKAVPGQFLDDFCYRLYRLLGYGNYTCDERESLNVQAAQWARRVQPEGRFPIETRPLVEVNA